MRRLLAQLGVAVVAFAAFFAALAGYGWHLYQQPRDGAGDDIRIVVGAGGGVRSVAAELEAVGAIGSRWVFLLGSRLEGFDRRLRAGEYLLPANASPAEIATMMVEGRTVVRKLTVAEGLLSSQILDVLANAEGLQGEIAEIPPEGSLLPETYHYSWGDRRADIVARMQQSMQETLASLWPTRAAELPFATPEEAVILASIVEKETGVAAERPEIAGVFVNRLRKGMRLQSDPTVAYGITEGKAPLGRPLSRADLRDANAYNTYVIDGLPPGPIANPGRASIAAVLNPATTSNFYFVADGSGGHAFSETLNGHLRNVREWRKLQRQSQ
ncbi:endolytic transglycosylase MltG [Oceanibacterium hippocampi]|uniref:Endolytic murein transglycosylase n=1 Tax=Oceanibacterium hippocampi TaxID=745714 RepID=A0A1Y5STV1_9PROT|nr:endolytic transglycosylase MltG [Oceanibacterium hippocampi]SLN48247.1 putative aminodeoxychorismate lyase [Oceanibacterium hippocampi]